MKKLILLYIPIVGIYMVYKYPQETAGKNIYHFCLSAFIQAFYTSIIIAYFTNINQ